MNAPLWLRRFLCRWDQHVAPDGWELLADDWPRCARCGEPFDAQAQADENAEMQALSL